MVTETASVTNEMTAFDDYLRYGTDEELSKGVKTRSAYLYTVGVFRQFLDGRQPTPELAKAFLKSLEEKGNRATSVNRHIWALKIYFRYFIQKTGNIWLKVLMLLLLMNLQDGKCTGVVILMVSTKP